MRTTTRSQNGFRDGVQPFTLPSGAANDRPWNHPLSIASWKITPAPAAGNGVVLKPSGRFGLLPDGVRDA
jgi:delta 1-pyrroline-5-carboxylate dehydrogenase